jgi:V/A-type H+-transporting ATPase subunit B
LRFGEAFEKRFLKQSPTENRSIEETLDIAWDILSILPESELTNIRVEYIKKYYRGKSSGGS